MPRTHQSTSLESLDEIRAFLQIVESGSQTAAARVLGASASVVSRRLDRLEERLGVRLIERTTRSHALTHEGRRALVHLRQALASLDALEDELAPGGRVRGELRVALPTLMTAAMMRELAPLLDRHPDLDIRLHSTDQALDMVALGLDVWVTPRRPDSPELVARSLGHFHAQLCAAPGYFRDGREPPQTPAELTTHRCLRFREELAPQKTWTLLDAAGTAHEVPVDGNLFSDSSIALEQALFAGAGIGIQVQQALETLSAAGTLVPVLPEYRFEPFEMFAVYPRSRRRQKRVRLFVDAAVAVF